jgi:uncharacterized hydrophobic protein (TIGR00271 family)
MSEAASSMAKLPEWLNGWRDRFATSLGVSPQRKEDIYLDLSKSATLRDPSYWLQILFAAGIATLGLALNSPAVIIGAMLISPLMGPILASGLAFASGDLALGLRASLSLLLSCVAAIAFSVLLVGLLPFKEMTNEIAARTQPNTLDLVVALFSGAIGSMAICREVKGVVTSIPGVAIAVALMPPLCVVGYGVGLAISLNGPEGVRVARGGGLLFLTNLVAITFTAMLVFLALHIDTAQVKERVREWRRGNRESVVARRLLRRFRISDRVRNIGGLPGRLVMILVTIALLLIPLTQSLGQLKGEITRQQQENRVRRAATQLWQRYFEKLPSGEARSFLDSLAISEAGGKLSLTLRIFDTQPYTEPEKTEYTRLVAEGLGRPADSVRLQLIEIPTAGALLAAKAGEDKRGAAPSTVAQLRADFWQGVEAAMQGVRLPPSAQLLGYRVVNDSGESTRVVIVYLGERDIEGDAQALIADDVRSRLAIPNTELSCERVQALFGPIVFRRNQASLPAGGSQLLDQIGHSLKQHSDLRAEVVAQAEGQERERIAEERGRAVSNYLSERCGVAADRIKITTGAIAARNVIVKLTPADQAQ